MKILSPWRRFALIAGLSLALIACNPISQENFNKIQDDMTMEQVTAIIGQPSESSSIGLGPVSGTNAVWKGEKGTITIQFFNGKVKVKTFEGK
jgi:hypothetical protein